MSSPEMNPNALILYGATGDLAHRSVIPAIYELATRDLLPRELLIIGNGRGQLSDEQFRDDVKQALEDSGMTGDDAHLKSFLDRCHFAGGGFSVDDPGKMLDVLRDKVGDDANVLHYFAVPPKSFVGFTKAVKAHGLNQSARAVYEKPFGTSLETFRDLDALVRDVFEDDQVYRIDHFVGKEGALNMVAARFSNKWLGDIWNRESVECVQIDVPEKLDIKDRADFYDHTGAFLDMIVTHLIQLVGLVAMEPPVSMGEKDFRAARDAALGCLRPLREQDVVLGQFDGYTDTAGIAPDSKTDTFAAVRVFVDSDRWRDVPFLLRTGKMMEKSQQRVTLVMRKPDGPVKHIADAASIIKFDLAASGGVEMGMVVKEPGAGMSLDGRTTRMELDVSEEPQALRAYARLIHDAISGDHSFFTTSDGLANVWTFADGFLDQLREKKPAPHGYAVGSWGPVEQDKLAFQHGWV